MTRATEQSIKQNHNISLIQCNIPINEIQYEPQDALKTTNHAYFLSIIDILNNLYLMTI